MPEPKAYRLGTGEAGSPNALKKPIIQGAEAMFVTDILDPELIVFTPEKPAASSAAVIICPGGGFAGLALQSEGYDCAAWLASQGINGMVLKYRQPAGHKEIPLLDIQDAMLFVRRHAEFFNVRRDRVGVCGFSAGGHLAAQASTLFTDETRPDFALLYYPDISLNAELGGETRDNLLGSRPTDEDIRRFSCHLQVRPNTPPTLLMLCDDDSLSSPLHSILYYAALKQHGISASMHIFPYGDHAWGFRGESAVTNAGPFEYMEEMKDLAGRWLTWVLSR